MASELKQTEWPTSYGIKDDGPEEPGRLLEQIQQKDVILFMIESTSTMLKFRKTKDDNSGVGGYCKLLEVIKVCYELLKKKIVCNPKDRVGIMIFNTETGSKTGLNVWNNCKFINDLNGINAASIKTLRNLVQRFERDPEELKKYFNPLSNKPNQLHEALRASLNRFKECVPKQASKRLFFITDNLNHHNNKFIDISNEAEDESDRLKRIKTCHTLSKDLSETGITIDFFFLGENKFINNNDLNFSDKNQEERFDFYSKLLDNHISITSTDLKRSFLYNLMANSGDYNDTQEASDPSHEIESLKKKFEKLLHDSSMRESEKRSVFKLNFKIGKDYEIGISGFVTVVEEKRKSYVLIDPFKHQQQHDLHNANNHLVNDDGQVKVITQYRDIHSTAIVDPKDILDFFQIGVSSANSTKNNEKNYNDDVYGSESYMKKGDDQKNLMRRVILEKDELIQIRSLGLDKGLKLLGFIDKDEIYFKHHTKHSYFIYPNEKIIIGSNRVFTALLNSMIKKNKIGIGILSCKKRDVPYLVSISPQEEVYESLEDMINNSNSQKRPAGMNLCILPWADEIRELNINEPQLDCITKNENEDKAFENESEQGKKIIEITEKIIKKLRIIYSPNNIKNPALQFHYDFLSSKYLSENFEETEDTSLPWYSLIQQKCGNLISELKKEIENDSRVESSLHTMPSSSSLLSKKRRRIEDGEGVDLGLVESKFKANKQSTLVVQQLKDYLIFKNVLKKPGISGGMSKNLLKADLIELVRTNLIKEGKL